MIVFCGNCANEKGWKRPVVRVSKKPCDICGGFDEVNERRINRRTGAVEIKLRRFDNFEHRADMLRGTPEEQRLSTTPVQ